MKTIYLDSKDFLFKSSMFVRNTFILSMTTFSASILLFIIFLAMGRVYKDVFGKIHYQVRHTGVDITSLVLNVITIVMITIILYNYVNIFGFVNTRVAWYLLVFLLVSMIILSAQVVFLVMNFCNDPDKIYNEDGKCICKNNLLEINGKCTCPHGYYLFQDSCIYGCRGVEDCQGEQCVGGFCCPSPNIACDNQCCPPDLCNDGVCCGSSDRQCLDPKTGITECCPPGTMCMDNSCVSVCGPSDNLFTCSDGESCLQINGDQDSLKSLQSSFPPEQKSVISGNTLYTCAKPPSCSLQPYSVFNPPIIANDDITFYPCYRAGKWTDLDDSKVKPEDNTKYSPLQLNICVPKYEDATYDQYQNCWKKIRNGTENNIYNCQGDECDLVNILKVDYTSNTPDTQRVNKAMKYQFLSANDEGTFKGSYCGDGGVRIRSVRFSDTCKDLQDKTHASLQGGVYSDSRYVYFDDNVCNTYFDCASSNEKDPFFKSYRYDNVDTTFPSSPLISGQSNAIFDYMVNCPTECPQVSDTVWPTNNTNYCECPSPLNYIESQRTGSESQWVYNTDLCTNTGYIVHEQVNPSNLVCQDENHCRPRTPSDNPQLHDFSDETTCTNYCAQVIFTNVWYNISICNHANIYDTDFSCGDRTQIQIKFNVAGDYQELKIPVMTQTDHYDISVKKQDGSDVKVYFDGSISGGDRFATGQRVFYISKDQNVCCTTGPRTCPCPDDKIGDGPNENLPNRELLSTDRFVFGTSTASDLPTNQIWYLGYWNSAGNLEFNSWGDDCSSGGFPLYEGICVTKKENASTVEPFYLRFV